VDWLRLFWVVVENRLVVDPVVNRLVLVDWLRLFWVVVENRLVRNLVTRRLPV